MPAPDFKKIKPGKKMKLPDDSTGYASGAYMSRDGIVLTVKVGSSIVMRNVLMKDIKEVEEDEEEEEDDG